MRHGVFCFSSWYFWGKLLDFPNMIFPGAINYSHRQVSFFLSFRWGVFLSFLSNYCWFIGGGRLPGIFLNVSIKAIQSQLIVWYWPDGSCGFRTPGCCSATCTCRFPTVRTVFPSQIKSAPFTWLTWSSKAKTWPVRFRFSFCFCFISSTFSFKFGVVSFSSMTFSVCHK